MTVVSGAAIVCPAAVPECSSQHPYQSARLSSTTPYQDQGRLCKHCTICICIEGSCYRGCWGTTGSRPRSWYHGRYKACTAQGVEAAVRPPRGRNCMRGICIEGSLRPDCSGTKEGTSRRTSLEEKGGREGEGSEAVAALLLALAATLAWLCCVLAWLALPWGKLEEHVGGGGGAVQKPHPLHLQRSQLPIGLRAVGKGLFEHHGRHCS